MKQIKLNEKKLNNKGFSLIEVLVAIIILTIVSLPLLTAFILSTRFNTKARTNQQVTAAAESVMEEFKNTNMMNMIWKYISDTNCDVVNDADGTPPVDTETGRAKTLRFTKNDLDFDGTKYDVEIIATPRKLLDSDSEVFRNLAKPNILDPARDCVMTLSLTNDESAYNSFKAQILNLINESTYNIIAGTTNKHHIYTDSELQMTKVEITRNITITVKDNPAPGKADERIVNGVVEYQCKVINYPVFNVNTGGISYINTTLPVITYSDAFGPEKIYKTKESPLNHTNEFFGNVYLFYYPGYEKGRIRIKNDNIILNYSTASDLNINMHLYKQVDTLNTGLYTLEQTYRPNVTKNESVAIVDGRYTKKIILYHNYGTNLAYVNDPTNVNAPLSTFSEPSADLVEKYPMAMIHELEVKVYEDNQIGVSGPIYTMKGSMNSYN